MCNQVTDSSTVNKVRKTLAETIEERIERNFENIVKLRNLKAKAEKLGVLNLLQDEVNELSSLFM